jgi:hypothetical protein
LNASAAGLAVAGLGGRTANAACSVDNDCKGDRICENGVCVAPATATAPAPAPAAPALVAPAPVATAGAPVATVTATPAAMPTATAGLDPVGDVSGFEIGLRLADQIPGGRFGALSSSSGGFGSAATHKAATFRIVARAMSPGSNRESRCRASFR